MVACRADIQTIDLTNALQSGAFPEYVKASEHTFDGFFHRHELSLKSMTLLKLKNT